MSPPAPFDRGSRRSADAPSLTGRSVIGRARLGTPIPLRTGRRLTIWTRAIATLRALLVRAPRLFVALFTPDDDELGRLGESVAARYLARRGFRILARRLRTRAGEADLVGLVGGEIVVVEVKSGRVASVPRPRGVELGDDVLLRWRPGARCDARRLARLFAIGWELRGLASSSHPRESGRTRPRVDLIEVFLHERRGRFRVLHHPDLRVPPTR